MGLLALTVARIRTAPFIASSDDPNVILAFHREMAHATRPHDSWVWSVEQAEALIGFSDPDQLFTFVSNLLNSPVVASIGLFSGTVETLLSPLTQRMELFGPLVGALRTTAYPQGTRLYGDHTFEELRRHTPVWNAGTRSHPSTGGLFALTLIEQTHTTPSEHAIERSFDEWIRLCHDVHRDATTRMDTSSLGVLLAYQDAFFDSVRDHTEAQPQHAGQALADLRKCGIKASQLPRLREALDGVLDHADALETEQLGWLMLFRVEHSIDSGRAEASELLEALESWFEEADAPSPELVSTYSITRAARLQRTGRGALAREALDRAHAFVEHDEAHRRRSDVWTAAQMFQILPEAHVATPELTFQRLDETLSDAYAAGNCHRVMSCELAMALWFFPHDVEQAKKHLNESIRLAKALHQFGFRAISYAVILCANGDMMGALDILGSIDAQHMTPVGVLTRDVLRAQLLIGQGDYTEASKVLNAPRPLPPNTHHVNLELHMARYALAACQGSLRARPEFGGTPLPDHITTALDVFDVIQEMVSANVTPERIARIKQLLGDLQEGDTWRTVCRTTAMRLFPLFFQDEDDDTTLVLSKDSSVYTCGGQRHDVSSRVNIRNILHAFVENHVTDQRHLSTDELFARGWPEHVNMPTSFANRVYVALAHLRNHGLKPFIERSTEGYRLRTTTLVLIGDGC